MENINEDLSPAQEITLISELLKENLELRDLLSIHLSLKTYMQALDQKSSVRFKGLQSKIINLIKQKRNAQPVKKVTPMAELYLRQIT